MFPQTCSYRAQSITLLVNNQPYNLGALLLAIDPKFPLQGREISIQVDKLIAGSVRIGDSSVTGSNCGYAMTDQTPPRIYRSDKSDIPLNMIWAIPGIGGLILNIEVMQ
jgi:hypothetical protein